MSSRAACIVDRSPCSLRSSITPTGFAPSTKFPIPENAPQLFESPLLPEFRFFKDVDELQPAKQPDSPIGTYRTNGKISALEQLSTKRQLKAYPLLNGVENQTFDSSIRSQQERHCGQHVVPQPTATIPPTYSLVQDETPLRKCLRFSTPNQQTVLYRPLSARTPRLAERPLTPTTTVVATERKHEFQFGKRIEFDPKSINPITSKATINGVLYNNNSINNLTSRKNNDVIENGSITATVVEDNKRSTVSYRRYPTPYLTNYNNNGLSIFKLPMQQELDSIVLSEQPTVVGLHDNDASIIQSQQSLLPQWTSPGDAASLQTISQSNRALKEKRFGSRRQAYAIHRLRVQMELDSITDTEPDNIRITYDMSTPLNKKSALKKPIDESPLNGTLPYLSKERLSEDEGQDTQTSVLDSTSSFSYFEMVTDTTDSNLNSSHTEKMRERNVNFNTAPTIVSFSEDDPPYYCGDKGAYYNNDLNPYNEDTCNFCENENQEEKQQDPLSCCTTSSSTKSFVNLLSSSVTSLPCSDQLGNNNSCISSPRKHILHPFDEKQEIASEENSLSNNTPFKESCSDIVPLKSVSEFKVVSTEEFYSNVATTNNNASPVKCLVSENPSSLLPPLSLNAMSITRSSTMPAPPVGSSVKSLPASYGTTNPNPRRKSTSSLLQPVSSLDPVESNGQLSERTSSNFHLDEANEFSCTISDPPTSDPSCLQNKGFCSLTTNIQDEVHDTKTIAKPIPNQSEDSELMIPSYELEPEEAGDYSLEYNNHHLIMSKEFPLVSPHIQHNNSKTQNDASSQGLSGYNDCILDNKTNGIFLNSALQDEARCLSKQRTSSSSSFSLKYPSFSLTSNCMPSTIKPEDSLSFRSLQRKKQNSNDDYHHCHYRQMVPTASLLSSLALRQDKKDHSNPIHVKKTITEPNRTIIRTDPMQKQSNNVVFRGTHEEITPESKKGGTSPLTTPNGSCPATVDSIDSSQSSSFCLRYSLSMPSFNSNSAQQPLELTQSTEADFNKGSYESTTTSSPTLTWDTSSSFSTPTPLCEQKSPLQTLDKSLLSKPSPSPPAQSYGTLYRHGRPPSYYSEYRSISSLKKNGLVSSPSMQSPARSSLAPHKFCNTLSQKVTSQSEARKEGCIMDKTIEQQVFSPFSTEFSQSIKMLRNHEQKQEEEQCNSNRSSSKDNGLHMTMSPRVQMKHKPLKASLNYSESTPIITTRSNDQNKDHRHHDGSLLIDLQSTSQRHFLQNRSHSLVPTPKNRSGTRYSERLLTTRPLNPSPLHTARDIPISLMAANHKLIENVPSDSLASQAKHDPSICNDEKKKNKDLDVSQEKLHSPVLSTIEEKESCVVNVKKRKKKQKVTTVGSSNSSTKSKKKHSSAINEPSNSKRVLNIPKLISITIQQNNSPTNSPQTCIIVQKQDSFDSSSRLQSHAGQHSTPGAESHRNVKNLTTDKTNADTTTVTLTTTNSIAFDTATTAVSAQKGKLLPRLLGDALPHEPILLRKPNSSSRLRIKKEQFNNCRDAVPNASVKLPLRNEVVPLIN